MKEKKYTAKKIITMVFILLFTAYITTAAVLFVEKPGDQVCRDVVLTIKDTVNAGFVAKREVIDMLQEVRLNPIGKTMDEIHTQTIEEFLSKHPLIDEVECYKTLSGKLYVEVRQRIPILRVMSKNGENYYIDNKGKVMPASLKTVAHLPVVTGDVDKLFAARGLYKLGLFLYENKFWDAQIEQINVLSEGEIELVPRVGDHIIFIGNADRLEQKFDRLKLFYLKALNKVGWDKYSYINLEFENQIVCTKRKG